MAGVLILIEQHDPVLVPQRHPDPRVPKCQRRSDLHLVGEIDHAALAFRVREGLHQRQNPLPVLQPLDVVGQSTVQRTALSRARRCGAQRGEQVVQDRGQRLGAGQVIGKCTGDRQEPFGDLIRAEVGVQVAVPTTDNPSRQLPGTGRGEYSGCRFHPGQRAEIGDEPAAEGVVGRDLRFAGQAAAGGELHQIGADEHSQSAPDPLAQRRGGLAGEGQTEHLLGPDLAGRHQVNNPSGHRLGLSGPGPRDHQRRLQRGLDDRHLFIGGFREAKVGGQLAGADHRVTCRPSGCSGQLVRTGHLSQ